MRHVEERADVALFGDLLHSQVFLTRSSTEYSFEYGVIRRGPTTAWSRLPLLYHRPGCLLLSTTADTQRSACCGYPGRAPRCWRGCRTRAAGEGTGGGSMVAAVGRDRFWEMFKGRAVMVAELPAGPSRALATVASESAGRDGAFLRTRADYEALFDLLLTHVPPDPPAK